MEIKMTKFANLMILITVILSICLFGRASKDSLAVQLQALHARWFAAYAEGDGAVMDGMEMPNLVLVMPDGYIIHKTEARAGKQRADKGAMRSLETVSIRQFGDAAVLTGVLVTRRGTAETREPTTVVFVKVAGVWKIASAHWSALPSQASTK
jgi:hypothetical protein